MLRVGIMMAGCGSFDGSDPTQAVALHLLLSGRGHLSIPFAVDREQRDVIDPLSVTGLPPRNMRSESARLFRGQCRSSTELDSSDLDALVIPGGLGVVKSLCDVAVSGPVTATADESCARLLDLMHEQRKPIGVLGEAVALVALCLRDQHIELATGHDPVLVESVEKLGQRTAAEEPGTLVLDGEHAVASIVVRSDLETLAVTDAIEALWRGLEDWLSMR